MHVDYLSIFYLVSASFNSNNNDDDDDDDDDDDGGGGDDDNNNNNNNKLQLVCHQVAVVILHVYKI